MAEYPAIAVERVMKVQEAILRAMAKHITRWQAAELLGISGRSMLRWRKRHEERGYDGHAEVFRRHKRECAATGSICRTI